MPALGCLPRVVLAHLPTPLEELPRLSAALGGPRLFIKRDDETGLATGGNKTRKLEFLVGAALARGADTLITAGAPQSNHARQTAAAAAKCGLRCILVLTGAPPAEWQGNLLLDAIFGAEVRWVGDVSWADIMANEEQVADEVRRAGGTPYVIPVGGSNPVGAAGYVAAMGELMGQSAERGLHMDSIVFASSSGGTQAGIVVGAKMFEYQGRLEPISIADKGEHFTPLVGSLARETAAFLELDVRFEDTDFRVRDGYLGAGYAKPGAAEAEAIRLLARTEGILVDPVYTGRALAGLLDLVRRGEFSRDENVLFWHTGGTPALFAYPEGLLP